MEAKFKYKYDKRTLILSVIQMAIVAGILIFIVFFFERSYLQAWLLSVMIAILILYILSIPRYIRVDDDNFEIQCIVEMTRIDIRDISSIRKIDRKGYSGRLFLILGSYGFFGYYGYFFNFRKWELFKVYITEKNHLVEIEDIYEQKYIVSCRESDRLIETVMQMKLEHAGESTVTSAEIEKL